MSISGSEVVSWVPETVITTSVPGSELVIPVSVSLVTMLGSGTELVISVPGYLLTTCLSRSAMATSINGSFITSSASCSYVTTSIPGYLITELVSPTMATLSAPGSLTTKSPVPSRMSTTTATGPGSRTGPSAAEKPVVPLTAANYFVGAYLPTLLAIILRIFIGVIYSTAKMMEPFYLLAGPAGALAKDVLTMNFLSTNDSIGPLMAIFRGHWLMLWVSTLYLVVGFLTPFSAEFLLFRDRCTSPSQCAPEPRVVVSIGRVLQALLACAAVMIVAFWWLGRRYRGGIYSDPSSIATLASVAHHPDVVADIRRIHPDATKNEMGEALARKRYTLGFYCNRDGAERYGLVPVSVQAYTGKGLEEKDRLEVGSSWGGMGPNAVLQRRRRRAASRRRMYRLIRDVLFGLVTCAVLIMVIYYYQVAADSAFERFFDSQSFGPRFVMSIAGIMIHSHWKRIERGGLFIFYPQDEPLLLELTFKTTTETCILEPFRNLSQGNAGAKSSILVDRTLSPITSFFTAIWRRQFFVALVSFMAILSEILIITLSGVPYNAGVQKETLIVSILVSIGIMSLMLMVLIGTYVRRQGRRDVLVNLPRHPDTIASVLSYLCGGRLVDDFADLARLKGKKRNRIVQGWKRRYVLKKDLDRDGVRRLGVDYDGGGGEGGENRRDVTK